MNTHINPEAVAVITHEVERINPHDAVERAHRQDVLAWLKSGANPFRLEKPDRKATLG